MNTLQGRKDGWKDRRKDQRKDEEKKMTERIASSRKSVKLGALRNM